MPFNTRAGRHRHCYVVAKGGDRHVTRPTKGLSLSRLARTRSNRPLSRSASLSLSGLPSSRSSDKSVELSQKSPLPCSSSWYCLFSRRGGQRRQILQHERRSALLLRTGSIEGYRLRYPQPTARHSFNFAILYRVSSNALSGSS